MEEIIEAVLKGVLRLFGVVIRSFVWLMLEVCFELVAWYIGWPICRAISLGKLPQVAITEQEQASTLTQIVVSLVGASTLIGLAIFIGMSLI